MASKAEIKAFLSEGFSPYEVADLLDVSLSFVEQVAGFRKTESSSNAFPGDRCNIPFDGRPVRSSVAPPRLWRIGSSLR